MSGHFTHLIGLLLSLLLGLQSLAGTSLTERYSRQVDLAAAGKQLPNLDKLTRVGFVRFARLSSTFYKFEDSESTPLFFEVRGYKAPFVTDFDVAPDGSIVVAGFVERTLPRVSFLAVISRDGRQTSWVNVGPYVPNFVSVPPDGSIWTVGYAIRYGADGADLGANPDADVVRHFTASGVLLGSKIKERSAPVGGVVSGYLIATAERIGWYAPTYGQVQNYVEISPDLETVSVFPGIVLRRGSPEESPEALQETTEGPNGFALTASGEVFLSTENRRAGTFGFYEFDRNLKQWSPIRLPLNVRHRLNGCIDNGLVFWGKEASGFVRRYEVFDVVH